MASLWQQADLLRWVLEATVVAWRSCGPWGRTVSTVTFWDRLTWPFCQLWQLLPQGSCTKLVAAIPVWKYTVTLHACCLHGRYRFGSRCAAHHSDDPALLLWQHHEWVLPAWSTNAAIAAFQGKALIARQSALRLLYTTVREIRCSASLGRTSKTYLWEQMEVAHKNPLDWS